MSTYLESAEGQTMTRARALQELVNHGCIIELDDFDLEMGVHEVYDAQSVLYWLGY